MSNFKMNGYIDVPARLRMALEQYPDLRIGESKPHIIHANDRSFIEVTITVWRDETDTHPVNATAWEPFPGSTPYTRNSEMMNCATSALGRALGYMGFGIARSISTSDEIANRRGETHPSVIEADPAPVQGIERPPSDAQLVIIGRICEHKGITEMPALTTRRQASAWIKDNEK